MKHDLNNIPFFSELDEDVLDAISQRLLREHYHKGATVFLEDEPGDCMYLIESGQVKIVTEKGGHEKILAYLGPGNFFGEMALFERAVRSATVRALGEARVLTIDKKNFLRRVREDPSLAFRLVQAMSARVRELSTEVSHLRLELEGNFDQARR